MTPMKKIVPGFNIPVVEFAKDQPEYITLPAVRLPDGTVVTRWSLTWKERLLIAIGGSIWLSIQTFNRPLQPVKLDARCPIMGHTGYDKEV